MSTVAGTIGSRREHIVPFSNIIVREGFNPRMDYGEIADLANSIEAQGVLLPLRVIRAQGSENFELVDGHRRYKAIEMLTKEQRWKHEGVPVIIVDRAATMLDQLALVVATGEGKPLLPLEEGAAYAKMIELGSSFAAIAKLVGKSEVHVRDRVGLAGADDTVKEAVKAGKVGVTVAQQIVNRAKKDKGKQAELVTKAASGKTARKEVQAEVDPEKRKARLTANLVRKNLMEAQERTAKLFEEGQCTRTSLKKEVDQYDAIFAAGYEKALADLVKLLG